MRPRSRRVLLSAVCATLTAQQGGRIASDATPAGPQLNRPTGVRMTYDVEWRLVHAGTAVIDERPNWVQLKLESSGLVSTLFKVHDTYTANYDDPFCVTSSLLDASEGKRHHETQVLYDRGQNHAFYMEKDLANNSLIRSTGVDIPV